ncbi:MAG: hypothetical protein NVS9B10_10400 [Nevskia sp.]
MQIKIEIDVKPEELRRFLGLPDVAGLQEDLIHFVREKLGAASDSFDPASFVKENLQSLRESAAWRKLVSAAKATTATTVTVVPETLKKTANGRSGSNGKPKRAAARKPKAARRPSAAKPPDAE